ncbi:MAG: hypothetical protein WC554_07700 [Clostridia bacterium]|jgi:hypothetical protein
MAIHTFICEKCESRVQDAVTTVHKCPNCGNEMYWDLSGANMFGDGTYSKELVSESMAISSSQVAEHKKLFPNVKLTKKDGCFCPTFGDFKTHDSYLKACGFVKHPQRPHNTRKYYTGAVQK